MRNRSTSFPGSGLRRKVLVPPAAIEAFRYPCAVSHSSASSVSRSLRWIISSMRRQRATPSRLSAACGLRTKYLRISLAISIGRSFANSALRRAASKTDARDGCLEKSDRFSVATQSPGTRESHLLRQPRHATPLTRPPDCAIPASCDWDRTGAGVWANPVPPGRNRHVWDASRFAMSRRSGRRCGDKDVRERMMSRGRSGSAGNARYLDEVAPDVVAFHQASEDAPVLAGQAGCQGDVSSRLTHHVLDVASFEGVDRVCARLAKGGVRRPL